MPLTPEPDLREERRWVAALAEHEAAVHAFAEAVGRVPPEGWHRSPASGKWTAAELVLHVTRSYELGRDAVAGGTGMRVRVSPVVAWLSRTLVLPLVLATGRFPRAARAPYEVRPDAAEAARSTPGELGARLRRSAAEAASAIRASADLPRAPRVTHAYFGALDPRRVLRLLSAHTRHHGRQLGD